MPVWWRSRWLIPCAHVAWHRNALLSASKSVRTMRLALIFFQPWSRGPRSFQHLGSCENMWDILPWWFNLLLVTWCLQHFLLLTRYTLWFYDVYGSILLWWYNLWLVMVYDITRWCMMFTMMLWLVIWCLEHSITLSHHYEWGYVPILTWLARC